MYASTVHQGPKRNVKLFWSKLSPMAQQFLHISVTHSTVYVSFETLSVNCERIKVFGTSQNFIEFMKRSKLASFQITRNLVVQHGLESMPCFQNALDHS